MNSVSTKSVSVEADSTFGWSKFVGCKGLSIGLDQFGASVPYKVLAEKFGFVPAVVTGKIKKYSGC